MADGGCQNSSAQPINGEKQGNAGNPRALCNSDDNQKGVCHQKQKNVVYIYNDGYLRSCDRMIKVPHRATIVHSLIGAYGLLENMRLISPKTAQEEHISLFHSTDYLACLKKLSDRDDDEKYDEEAESYGLTYDCPVYDWSYEYACYVAGASYTAAHCLIKDYGKIAINWPGGWHHAKRDEASGFCYINDIVVAILKLRQKFDRVLYVDIDLHHGDGVEDAFCSTPKVMTVSFHKYSPGFFPGTGSIKDIGIGKGKYYAVNVPLHDGIQDESFCTIFQKVMTLVKDKFNPEAVVCQCGADGVVQDPMDTFNLTPVSLVNCVKFLVAWDLPTLLVGGGGYNTPNTARTWTSITAAVLGKTLPTEIPEHRFFTKYGPGYDLEVLPGNRVDKNPQSYLDEVYNTIHGNLSRIGQ